MKLRIPNSAPALGVAGAALFIALGGSGYAATNVVHSGNHRPYTAYNAKRLGGQLPSYYLSANHEATSHGERFLNAGQTVVLGKAGHFTFKSTCSKDSSGQNQVTFDVSADTTADLDGTGVVPAGTSVNIHTNSDALDTTPDNPKNPGDFDQVGSASDSTQIAADGQEVDVFYNDGVNWPAMGGSQAHDCFAGYTGLLG